uniref:Uncharacterized protein n=1 Tax=Ciona savignyi TaxID=51511 RepID=H2Y6F6_CIOSA
MTPPHDLIVDNEVEVTHDFIAEDEIKVDPSSSWSSPLLSSGMEEQHPQDELFIDGIAGLTDSSAEKLLQLSPNMCSVSTAEQQYALQQYVIGGESLDNIIEPSGAEDINAFRILSTSENEVAPLFKDTLVGAPHSNLFAGTTINLNDLQ